mmetsp:Transcript_16981/g.35909  ORF Transcript_16981/g.35909 Transcript_16981/m.35909 type:complete len:235 (-) Transcript_16981:84-788(-)
MFRMAMQRSLQEKMLSTNLSTSLQTHRRRAVSGMRTTASGRQRKLLRGEHGRELLESMAICRTLMTRQKSQRESTGASSPRTSATPPSARRTRASWAARACGAATAPCPTTPRIAGGRSPSFSSTSRPPRTLRRRSRTWRPRIRRTSSTAQRSGPPTRPRRAGRATGAAGRRPAAAAARSARSPPPCPTPTTPSAPSSPRTARRRRRPSAPWPSGRRSTPRPSAGPSARPRSSP